MPLITEVTQNIQRTQTHATLPETRIYFKLNQYNISLLKEKFFTNGYSYIFSQRNQGK